MAEKTSNSSNSSILPLPSIFPSVPAPTCPPPLAGSKSNRHNVLAIAKMLYTQAIVLQLAAVFAGALLSPGSVPRPKPQRWYDSKIDTKC